MKLDNKYRIERDELSYQLIETKEYVAQSGKRKGEEIVLEKTLYYPTLKGALMGYVNRVAEVNNNTSSLINQLKQIEQKIEELCLKR